MPIMKLFRSFSNLICVSAYSDVTKITLNDLAVKSNGNVSETHESASSDDQLLSEDDELMNGNVADEGMSNSWKSTDAEPVLQNTTVSKKSEQKTGIEPLSDVSVPLIEIKTGSIFD